MCPDNTRAAMLSQPTPLPVSTPPPHTPTPLPQWAQWLRTVRLDAGVWLGEAMAATQQRLQAAAHDAATPQQRQEITETLAAAQARHELWTRALVEALAQALDREAAGAPAAAAEPGPEPQRLELSLLDEDSIDEEIAVSRLVQVAEAKAESPLRELASLCAALRGQEDITPEANPLRPAVVAGALRAAAQGFGLPRAQRLVLLRELGLAVGTLLVAVYARQLEIIGAWNIEPARFTLRLTVAEHVAPPTLAQAAQQAATQPAPAPAVPPAASLPQLAAAAGALPGTPLDSQGAADAMARLLALLAGRLAASDGTRALLRRLDAPARRIAEHDPQLWTSLDHPLWQLLDRLVSAGSVSEGVTPSLEAAVERLETAPAPDAAQCRNTLDEVDFVITGLLGEESDQVAPQADALQARLALEQVEAEVRQQLVQQLRSAGSPPALRQFLLGPWARVLAQAAVDHGAESTEMKARADLVDRLVVACTRTAGETLEPERVARWCERARRGLQGAGFTPARIAAELADLERVLRRAPVHARPAAPALAAGVDLALPLEEGRAAEPAPAAPTAALGLHECLPTVPMEGPGPADADAPAREAGAWVDGLQRGACCRMFLLERWMNTQLLWRSHNGGMFVFKSRHGGRTHSLSRRALEKLRGAGLATTIEQGHWVAEALVELAGGGAARH